MKSEREVVEAGPHRSVLVKRYATDAFRVPSHHHPEAELTRIDAGSGRRTVGGAVGGFAPGDLVLLGPGLAHAWSAPEEGPGGAPDACRATVIQFDAAAASAAASGFREARAVAGLLGAAAGGLRFPAGTADRWIDAAAEAPAAAVPGLLVALLGVLAGSERRVLDAGAPTVGGTDPAVEAMTRLLQAGFRRPVPNAELAAAARLSESAATRRFRAAMGQTVTQYRHRLQLQAAEHLLVTTDRGVADVAAACGFPSAAHFHRLFRRQPGTGGLSPRRWAKRERAGPR